MVNKKMEVDSFLVKLLGAEGLWQASYTDSSLFFYFSDNDTGFNALKRNRAKVYHSKEPTETIFAKFIEKKFALSLALEKKSALVLW